MRTQMAGVWEWGQLGRMRGWVGSRQAMDGRADSKRAACRRVSGRQGGRAAASRRQSERVGGHAGGMARVEQMTHRHPHPRHLVMTWTMCMGA